MFHDTKKSDKIELLGEQLIKEYPEYVMDVLGAASRLGIGLGWHYVLDLIWILKELDCPPGSTILDAGSGHGLFQFILADNGYRVISADAARHNKPKFTENIYEILSFQSACDISHPYVDRHRTKKNLVKDDDSSCLHTKEEFNAQLNSLYDNKTGERNDETLPGIIFYHCDLENMPEIENEKVDAVVSVSALEHNSPEKTSKCIDELSRILKSDGKMCLTVSTINSENTFHQPSHSWLLNEQGLVDTYQIKEGYISNFLEYDSINSSIQDSKFLKKWLSNMYYRSGDNGMPWGKWDPQYQPVAIFKTK